MSFREKCIPYTKMESTLKKPATSGMYVHNRAHSLSGAYSVVMLEASLHVHALLTSALAY